MHQIGNLVRSKGDPKVLRSGASSMDAADRLARALGWFSIALGVMELVAPHRLTRNLGLVGKEPLVRAYGAREIASGLVTLSPDKRLGLWSRVAGDALDMASLMPALHPYNPKRGNAKLAQAMVIGVTALDVLAALATSKRGRNSHSSRRGAYRGRSGFPKGLSAARGAARPAKSDALTGSNQGRGQPLRA
jgi:hypothetical protein